MIVAEHGHDFVYEEHRTFADVEALPLCMAPDVGRVQCQRINEISEFCRLDQHAELPVASPVR